MSLLIGAAVGTLFLVPAYGLAQSDVLRLDPCDSEIIYMSWLGGLISCAETGHAPDQYTLGMIYAEGNDVPEDDAEAVRWYRLAAEQGDALAQTNLGFMYGNGDGVPRDLVFAYMWFNLSAAQGNETAQRNNEMIEQVMTREEIAEAQRLSREWLEAHPPAVTSPLTPSVAPSHAQLSSTVLRRGLLSGAHRCQVPSEVPRVGSELVET